MTTPLSPDLSRAERDRIARLFADIAAEAGVAVMDVYRSDFETRTKADLSPVSDADERAEAIILARLARDLPGVPAIAEESAARDGLSASAAPELFLLIDPVDGTKEFIQRKGDFTVNIALVARGVPVAGAVFAPARSEMYFGGACAWRSDNAAAPLAMKTRAYPAEGFTAVTSSSHLDPQTTAFLAARRVVKQTGIGSSLKFCLLARGEADLYPRFGPTMEWDTAAGQAVLMAAGGCVVTPEGEPFRYGKWENGYLNGAFIAWGNQPA